jgi:hypothetical protein
MATKIEAIKRTPAELISLDHYNSCNHCSDPERGYCDEGVCLARLCVVKRTVKRYTVYSVLADGNPWTVTQTDDAELALLAYRAELEKYAGHRHHAHGIFLTNDPEKGDVQEDLESCSLVCPNCDAMSEDGGLCWYCHDEQKRASASPTSAPGAGQVTDTDSYRLGEISMKARLYLECGGEVAYRELVLALNRQLDYLTPLPLEPVK